MKALDIVANKTVQRSHTNKRYHETLYIVKNGSRNGFDTFWKSQQNSVRMMSSRLSTKSSNNVHLCDGSHFRSNTSILYATNDQQD